MQYRFKDSFGLGSLGVTVTSNYLHSRPDTLYVEDVQSNPFYQKEDVDLIWHSNHGSFKVEVKTDSHNTGNIFFETVSNLGKGSSGCILTSSAEILCYVIQASSLILAMSMKAVRGWFLDRLNSFREVKSQTKVGSGFYTSLGRLIQ